MPIPNPNYNPPFNVTRSSHVILNVSDLAASKEHYVDMLGLVLTEQTSDALYLRGLDEHSHHSVVLRKSDSDTAGTVERIGLRVFSDDDLDQAYAYFQEQGVSCRFVDAPFQGKTLHYEDAVGMPVELCATMDRAPFMHDKFHLYRGGHPKGLDHFQVATHDVQSATDFYMAIGFRMSEYTDSDDSSALWGTWLQRKGNPQDIVFTNGQGPSLHHFAMQVQDVSSLIHACDIVGSLGREGCIDRGPARHGISNALFVYFRDPDGHRMEFYDAHYTMIDIDHEPIRWPVSNTKRSNLWGMPASRRWYYEVSEFHGVPTQPPLLRAEPMTLERFLDTQ